MSSEQETNEEKLQLKLCFLGSPDVGKTTLTAAIFKTLYYVVKGHFESSTLNFSTYFTYPNHPNHASKDFPLMIVTTNRIYSFLDQPGWKFQYEKLLEKYSRELTGTILVISAIEEEDNLIEELLRIKNQAIPILFVFMNKLDLVSNLPQNEQNIRHLLRDFGFDGEIPFVSGSALEALESQNLDPNSPEYLPIINLLNTMDKYFSKFGEAKS